MHPVLEAKQIREWDKFTIEHEPVSSLNLMERAAGIAFEYILKHYNKAERFAIFCGQGNNGGDGLVIARLLLESGKRCDVYILQTAEFGSPNFEANLKQLTDSGYHINYIQSNTHFPLVGKNSVIIDALFGTGLNRPLEGLAADLVAYLNSLNNFKASIDVPSGMPAEKAEGWPALSANEVLSFMAAKPAFFEPENAGFIGRFHILDIGLSGEFPLLKDVKLYYAGLQEAASLYKPPYPASHKGNNGKLLIMAGGPGKMGAAVLCASAAVHTGAGLTTAYIPKDGNLVLQTALPEVMTLSCKSNHLQQMPETDGFDVIALGPGIGTAKNTVSMVKEFLDLNRKPAVLDADALNILSEIRWKKAFKFPCILTPHPKEFDRMFGKCNSLQVRINKAVKSARALKAVIVLKGYRTAVIDSDGSVYFTQTGNAGLAKGGSGDLLTGIIGALLAKGYQLRDAALLGVYLHGEAAVAAAKHSALETITASKVISHISDAYLSIQKACSVGNL